MAIPAFNQKYLDIAAGQDQFYADIERLPPVNAAYPYESYKGYADTYESTGRGAITELQAMVASGKVKVKLNVNFVLIPCDDEALAYLLAQYDAINATRVLPWNEV